MSRESRRNFYNHNNGNIYQYVSCMIVHKVLSKDLNSNLARTKELNALSAGELTVYGMQTLKDEALFVIVESRPHFVRQNRFFILWSSFFRVKMYQLVVIIFMTLFRTKFWHLQ